MEELGRGGGIVANGRLDEVVLECLHANWNRRLFHVCEERIMMKKGHC